MWLQWILAFKLRSKGRPALGLDSVARTGFLVLPSDIDFLGHLNNGRYLSYMDLARVDWTIRAGFEGTLAKRGIYGVIGQSTMAYRKSLLLWQRFDIETALLGVDDRAVYFQQRFVVDGEVYARGVVQARFIRKGAGTVKTAEVSDILRQDHPGVELPRVSERIGAWAGGNALPPSRAAAPSDWDGRVPR